MGKINLFLFLFCFFLALNGCLQEGRKPLPSPHDLAKEGCIMICNAEKEKGTNLSNSPCLANPMEIQDYVCDIAHNPRTVVDDLQENQCSAFREGKARYFIELDENCELIKTG